MKNKGKQQQSITQKQGAMMNPNKADQNGLLDVIKLKMTPKVVYYFGFLACIDTSGNPFMFYHEKNRYINITTPSPALQIVFIDRKDGQLAISLKNNTIMIASCMNGRNLKVLKALEHSILNLHVNHNKGLLMSVSMDSVVLYSLESYDRVHSLFAKASPFVNACFMPSSTEFVTLFQDKSLSIWNLSSLEVLQRLTLPESQSVKHCQMMPSVDGNKVIINCYGSRIYTLDDQSNLTTQAVQPGYGSGSLLVKSDRKGRMFMLTKNQMLIQMNSCGNILNQVELPSGKHAVHFDVFNNILVLIDNSAEIMMYDLGKMAKQKNNSSTVGVNASILVKENFPDTINFNNSTNIEIKKVGESCTNMFATSQSTVKNNSKSMSQTQPYNTITIGKSYKNSTNPLRELMNHSKLEQFIKTFHIFPDDKRSLAWRSLMDLPMNQEAYNNLLAQGVHPAYARLADKYPIQSESLFSRLQRTLSCLAYYCPLFAEVDYLPQLVFPFVKLFRRGEELLIFEVTLSILVHFCQRFFESFPNAPISLLLFHDQVLARIDPELSDHLRNVLQFQSVKCVWPSVRCMYTDILSREQWMQLMDKLVVYNEQPQLLILFMVEYLRYFRNTLLRMNEPEQMQIFFSRQNAVEINRLFDRTLQLSTSLDYDAYPTTFQQFLPLQKEQYQIYNVYPKNSVNYQARVREQLQEDELKMQQKQQQIVKLQEMSEQLAKLDDLFKEKQVLSHQVEQDRKELFEYYTEMRAQKQLQSEQQLRQNRVQQIEQMDNLMRDAINQQSTMQQKEQEILNQQFLKVQMADNLRLQSAQEEEALQNLEYATFKKFTDFMDSRSKQEVARKIQTEMEYRQRQRELQDQLKTEQWKTESQEQQIRREAIRQNKLSELQEISGQNQQEEAEYQQMVHQFQQDLKMIQLEREKKLRDVMVSEQFRQEEGQLKDKHRLEERRRTDSFMRRQQIEQQMNEIARQHQDKIKQQEQQLFEQIKANRTNHSNNFEQSSSQDFREPMTSQKQSSGMYDYSSGQKRSFQSPGLVEEEREKFTQFRQQLREEINTLKEREHDDKLQQLLKEREDEIFKRTQQIREQINQETDGKDTTYNTGQFVKQQQQQQQQQQQPYQYQQHYSPHSSSQYSLYQPGQAIDIDPRDMSESQLTYSSGFTSPDHRY